MNKLLERTKAIIRGEAPPPPVARLIGFDLVSVEPGKSVIEFQATEAHQNPMGTLHGGILCDIADAAMGIAYASNLNEGESFTTLEQDQFFEARLECTIAGDRSRRKAGPH